MNDMTTPAPDAAWPEGFAFLPRVEALPAGLVKDYAGVPAAHVSDVIGRHVGALGLRAYHEKHGAVFCGPALTVRVRPGDNLMIHAALSIAQPGDVLVVDGAGDETTALMGGLMRTTAIRAGIAGIVIDGAIRDVAEWADGALPIFAKAHSHRGPSKNGPGEVNVPIACAGLCVMPGDLVIGDADGVVAIPAARAAHILPFARALAAREEVTRAENAAGATDAERIRKLLRDRGCPV